MQRASPRFWLESKDRTPAIASQKESRRASSGNRRHCLVAARAGGKTLAGLDLGDKTIGVAVSDRGLSFAHPRPVIMRKKFSLDAAALLALLWRRKTSAPW